jgi:acyl-CoA reductase-like NAD-dependent aldehyde dehydrogenase/uncharacterized protein (DUF2141 family)
LEHCRYYARYAHKFMAPRNMQRDWLLFPGTRFTEFHEPYGVVLVFGAGNYPLQLGMVPAITALYAGNSAVLKVSERTPLLAELLRNIASQSQLPSSLLQIVNDSPEQADRYIAARPDFICFTGSCENGARVAARAAQFLIPVLLELGGKDAAIVFSDCDLERSVEGVVYGAFVNSGQVCVGIKRVYIEESLYSEFLHRLIDRTNQLRIRADEEEDRDLAPIREKRVLERLSLQINDAIGRGARVLNSNVDLSGATPLILGDVGRDTPLLKEETFGPVLCVASFGVEGDAIQLANDSKFALGASVWTRDRSKAYRVAAQLSAANVSVNDVIRNIGNPATAFGGNRSSGYGRYHGAAGLLTFSRTKTVMMDYSHRSRLRSWFPFSRRTYGQLRKLIQIRYSILSRFARFLPLFLLLSLATSISAQQQGHLHLRVDLPDKADRGQLAYLIFDDADGFPNRVAKAYKHGFLPAGTSFEGVDLGALPKGRYAVSLYLDENGNRKLDTGWLGIPKEPVGVSLNPRHRMGPPRFNDSAFEMGAQDLNLEIRMVKP